MEDSANGFSFKYIMLSVFSILACLVHLSVWSLLSLFSLDGSGREELLHAACMGRLLVDLILSSLTIYR
jgi:hypothetical protein